MFLFTNSLSWFFYFLYFSFYIVINKVSNNMILYFIDKSAFSFLHCKIFKTFMIIYQ